MGSFASYAAALAFSVTWTVPDGAPAVEVESQFNSKSQTHVVRIGEVVVLAKDATLKLTAGKTLSGQASFSGSVRVEGKEFQCHCERAVYAFGKETWTFEKATIWRTKDGRTAVARADRMMFNPRARTLRAEQAAPQPQD